MLDTTPIAETIVTFLATGVVLAVIAIAVWLPYRAVDTAIHRRPRHHRRLHAVWNLFGLCECRPSRRHRPPTRASGLHVSRDRRRCDHAGHHVNNN